MQKTLAFTAVIAVAAGGIRAAWVPVPISWIPPVHAVQDDAELASINRLRSRDSASFRVTQSSGCSILFWKRRPDGAVDAFNGFWIDVFSGLSGVSHVSIDCGLERNGERWVMDSSPYDPKYGNFIDGPQYAPLRYWTGRTYGRGNLKGMIDSDQLRRDLRRMIDVGNIHHKSEKYWLLFIAGIDRKDLVSCSGYVARAIEDQPGSPLAKSLQMVLRRRWRYGEITPADLARAIFRCNAKAWHGARL
jgi:hypothetical protein